MKRQVKFNKWHECAVDRSKAEATQAGATGGGRNPFNRAKAKTTYGSEARVVNGTKQAPKKIK